MRFRRRRSHDTEAELNITAFLNLMVVLIPFLLINAVFAQVSILQLNLPAISDSSTPSEDDEKDKLLSSIPLGELGKPEDIAKTLSFLISASYVTGQIIFVDGGRSLYTGASA